MSVFAPREYCRCMLNLVLLFVTPWTVARQDPLFMGFFRQEYWSGFPFPIPADLPNPGIEPASPASLLDCRWTLLLSHRGKHCRHHRTKIEKLLIFPPCVSRVLENRGHLFMLRCVHLAKGISVQVPPLQEVCIFCRLAGAIQDQTKAAN